MELTKICNTCFAQLPYSSFYRNANGTCYAHCKECQKQKTMISRHKNIEGYRQYQNHYQNDPMNKIATTLRTKTKTALASYQVTIDRNIPLTHGATIQFLYHFLEFTKQFFIPVNYTGRIHIDHVLPLSRFNLFDSNQITFASNWTNHRYLTEHDNTSKGAKMPSKEDLRIQIRICKQFLCTGMKDYNPQHFWYNIACFDFLCNLNDIDYYIFTFRH